MPEDLIEIIARTYKDKLTQLGYTEINLDKSQTGGYWRITFAKSIPDRDPLIPYRLNDHPLYTLLFGYTKADTAAIELYDGSAHVPLLHIPDLADAAALDHLDETLTEIANSPHHNP